MLKTVLVPENQFERVKQIGGVQTFEDMGNVSKVKKSEIIISEVAETEYGRCFVRIWVNDQDEFEGTVEIAGVRGPDECQGTWEVNNIPVTFHLKWREEEYQVRVYDMDTYRTDTPDGIHEEATHNQQKKIQKAVELAVRDALDDDQCRNRDRARSLRREYDVAKLKRELFEDAQTMVEKTQMLLNKQARC